MLWTTYVPSGVLLIWARGQVTALGITPVLLALVLPCAPLIRRWVRAGRLGPVETTWKPGRRGLWLALLLPPVFWIACLAAARTQEAGFLWVTKEDGLMEWAQAACLAAGCIASLWLARHQWRQGHRRWAVAFLLFGLGLFGVMGEEISWGQRLTATATPAWIASRNTQEELNLHNLAGVDEAMSAWGDRGVMWSILLAAAGAATGLRELRRLRAWLWMPHPSLIPALLCAHSYGGVLSLWHLVHPAEEDIPELVSRLQEPKELILYAAMTGFLLMACAAQRGRDARAGRLAGQSSAPDARAA